MKLKRLFAALCAAVTAFCCAALQVSAENETDTPVYESGEFEKPGTNYDRNGFFREKDRAAFGTLPVCSKGKEAEYALGGVNMDGIIDTKDATAVLKEYACAIIELPHMISAEQPALADVDGCETASGYRVSSRDSQYILHYYNAVITELDGVEQMMMQEFVPYFDALHKKQ